MNLRAGADNQGSSPQAQGVARHGADPARPGGVIPAGAGSSPDSWRSSPTGSAATTS
jgi:hypothetical protein